MFLAAWSASRSASARMRYFFLLNKLKNENVACLLIEGYLKRIYQF